MYRSGHDMIPLGAHDAHTDHQGNGPTRRDTFRELPRCSARPKRRCLSVVAFIGDSRDTYGLISLMIGFCTTLKPVWTNGHAV